MKEYIIRKTLSTMAYMVTVFILAACAVYA